MLGAMYYHGLDLPRDRAEGLMWYRKAAEFLMVLGKDEAARVLKHMSSQEIEGITREIARIENIVVTDAELVNHLARVAQSRKVAPKKFIKDMQRSGRLQSIRSSIAIGKAIDFLVEHAEVVETAEAALTED